MPYTVRARHLHGGHARRVDEPTAEAAAVAYLEDFGHDADQDEAVSLIVRDQDTGREQCFRVDLATGETEPCG
ncbi:hypothetical protein B7G68_18520 [Caulobacter segnis]|jgi:hypothetical protein|uniref:Uncharacterized protein n=2 Tax=Caulobacter segnis TaxID=88688 RepID=D5VNG9_CAUST|nr:DUF5961 family protein [Caulobacter segnis]ADG12042.1 conserved hypothetical protein [Caulobacter segnis ATCC 21756]AVQ03654.1 hypothetical protein B7G68_18520 [Caulobacter segnis]